MHAPPLATFCCLLSAIAAGLPSQSTHLVGPGGFAQIQNALAVAAPGDDILVQPGIYESFTANIGVTIRSSGGTTIQPPLPAPPVTCSIPTGQALHLIGLEIRHNLHVLAGRVTMDGCSVFTTLNEAVLVQDAALHLQDCILGTMNTVGNALLASNSSITAVGGSFTSGAWLVIPTVVRLTASRFHASGTRIISGVLSVGGPCLAASAGSEVWICDSFLQTLSVAHCAVVHSGATVRLDRCTVLEGTFPSCGGGITPGLLLGVDRPMPLQAGAVFALDFRTNANGFVFVFACPALGNASWGPVLEQRSWLDDTQSFSTALLFADGNGDANASWQIPAGPGIVGQTMWFLGVSGLALPLQTSPVVGGVVR